MTKCNQHPDAPHGFMRDASHNADRYVCECEGWEPEPLVSVCRLVASVDEFKGLLAEDQTLRWRVELIEKDEFGCYVPVNI